MYMKVLRKNRRGQTSCDKENDATEHTSEKNSMSYRLQCGNHTLIPRKEIHCI